MNFTGNWFDIAFGLTVFIFALLAFLRGFIRDFFSFLNWLIAICLTYVLSPYIAKLFAKTSYSEAMISILVSSVSFIIILIIISIITSKISRSLSEKIPRSVDGSLGFAFGFAKGYFIVALIFAIITSVYSLELTGNNFRKNFTGKFRKRVGPQWLIKSQSYKTLEVGAGILKPVTNTIMKSIIETGLVEDSKTSLKNKIKDRMEKLDESEKYDDEETVPEKGYNFKEIQKMNRLIEIIDKQN